ncbi:DUF72 domain-containing protein [Halobacterium sp. KA-6]|uniref:DUF72 domain-containing protein n=1 Tax=Halobacterium sp. KA-6 TaxID=2896368 RepID=UPI001E4A2481|nr:DUF72 domain-containing protein [Halobacterium sp. KA-6]MCD2205019.1 DUF72 domain-containing protein [Halobacterium sp. KA-6]
MVTVGTCGYSRYDATEGWKDDYESKLAAFADAYESVELQSTFYELPQVSTAERWRREAGEEFTFALKAWQAVTHPSSSPTWNNHRDALPEGDVGYFKDSEAVRDAWDATLDRADALDADVVVLQTSPSFGPTEEHESNLREFFDDVDRRGYTIAWEPRDEWKDDPDRVADVCEGLDLVHVVNPLHRDPVDDAAVAYCRMHGETGDIHDYDYRYEDDELDDLADCLQELDADDVYVMFNNTHMFEDATRLRERLAD